MALRSRRGGVDNALGVGQVAGVLIGHAGRRLAGGRVEGEGVEELVDVLDHGGEVLGLSAVGGVVLEQLGVLLHGGAAAGGVDDNGVDAGVEEGVDVAAGQGAAGVALADVGAEGAAAALIGDDDLAAVAGEHGRGCLVHPAVDEGHDAAVEHAHAPRRRASGRYRLAGSLVEAAQTGELPFEAVQGAYGPEDAHSSDEGLESAALVRLQRQGERPQEGGVMEEESHADEDAEPLGQGAGALRRHLGAGRLHHAAVGDAGGAGGLAGAALQAEVEVRGDAVGKSDAALVHALHGGRCARGGTRSRRRARRRWGRPGGRVRNGRTCRGLLPGARRGRRSRGPPACGCGR